MSFCLLLQSSSQSSGEEGKWEAAHKSAVEIFQAAITSPLGLLGLMVLVIGLTCFVIVYVGKASGKVQLTMFAIMFCGVVAFGVAVMRVQREVQYDLSFKLLFPEGTLQDPDTAKVVPFVVRKHQPDALPQLESNGYAVSRGVGGLGVDIYKLSPGDLLHVEVEDEGKRWRSVDVKLPESQLQMHPVKHQAETGVQR
jgi:hypothetical protein